MPSSAWPKSRTDGPRPRSGPKRLGTRAERNARTARPGRATSSTDSSVKRASSRGARRQPWGGIAPAASNDSFHRSTAPSDWLEGLVKAYVGDGIGQDFYTEMAAYLDPETRALVLEVMADLGHSAFAVERVRAAIEADGRVAGRLALWGRRLVGEALTQAQRVAAERDALDALLVGSPDRPGMGLGGAGALFARIIEQHSRRMASLGLAA